jgi:hypothetical protein
MNSITRYLLLSIGLILVALLVFFLTGLTHLKKDQVAFVYHHKEMKRTLMPGWHYVCPCIYKESKKYVYNKDYKHVIHTPDHKNIYVVGKVLDPKTFDEAKPNLKDICLSLYAQSEGQPSSLEGMIKTGLETIGFQVSSVELH